MTIKEYKDTNGLTLGELYEQVKPIEPKITVPLLSYMCQGFIQETPTIMAWLSKREESSLTPTEASVLLYLKEKGETVSRRELRDVTKLPDRQSRRVIESLRSKGEWIVTGDEGYGYKYTTDRKELEEFLWAYTARSKTIFRNAAAMGANDPDQLKIGMNF